MECDWRCFNKNSKWSGHTNCGTCPCTTGGEGFLARSKADKKIIKDCNKLAALFYSAVGHDVAHDFKFHESTHSEEKAMWDLAVIAYRHIEGADVGESLENLKE